MFVNDHLPSFITALRSLRGLPAQRNLGEIHAKRQTPNTESISLEVCLEDLDHYSTTHDESSDPNTQVGFMSDVARAALYLASADASGHCAGQVITIAGGMEGRMLYQPKKIDLKRI